MPFHEELQVFLFHWPSGIYDEHSLAQFLQCGESRYGMISLMSPVERVIHFLEPDSDMPHMPGLNLMIMSTTEH